MLMCDWHLPAPIRPLVRVPAVRSVRLKTRLRCGRARNGGTAAQVGPETLPKPEPQMLKSGDITGLGHCSRRAATLPKTQLPLCANVVTGQRAP